MKKLIICFFCLPLLFACNNNSTEPEAQAEDDLDAARMFIRDALDGRWYEARQYMIQDSVNVQLLETAEARYQEMDKIEKSNYREAVPRFYGTRKLNDSTTVITYSNSYRNKKDSLKVVHTNGRWLIDLKYSLLPTEAHGE